MNSTITNTKLSAALAVALFASPALVRAQHNRLPARQPESMPTQNMNVNRNSAPRMEQNERPSHIERQEPSHIERQEPRQTERQAPQRTERREPVQTPKTQGTEQAPSRLPSHAVVPSRSTEPAGREPVRSTITHEPVRTSIGGPKAGSSREIETRHSDGTRVVAVGRNRGFVEHPIPAHPGYVSRTYVAGGHSYARVYREFSFHGLYYHVYVPRFFFQPLFYGWVFDPWPAPVYFAWGWDVAPWYVYYGPYFHPAPVYAAPALWLTDFVLAENLKAAYENQQAAGEMAPNAETSALSGEVKQLVAEEVKRQIADERTAAAAQGGSPVSAEVPPALDPAHRVFVVSMSLNVPTATGTTCTLTPGDIILRTPDAVGANNQAGVTVLASKAGDCAVNTSASVDATKLQEMLNQFREQIDNGLNMLAANQGHGGLPPGPAPKPRLSADGVAQPDPAAAAELLDQQQAAERMEAEAEQANNQ